MVLKEDTDGIYTHKESNLTQLFLHGKCNRRKGPQGTPYSRYSFMYPIIKLNSVRNRRWIAFQQSLIITSSSHKQYSLRATQGRYRWYLHIMRKSSCVLAGSLDIGQTHTKSNLVLHLSLGKISHASITTYK